MLNRALKNRKIISFLILAMVFSQTFAQYEIKKYSINSGGKTMSEGQYELNSSIGQTDANGNLAAGDYSLNAGFRQENKDLIYKNRFE